MIIKILPKAELELYTDKSPGEIQGLLFDSYYQVKDGKATKKYKRRKYAGAGNHFEIFKEIINNSRSTIKASGFILYQKKGSKILIKFTVIDSYAYYFSIFWIFINLLLLVLGLYVSISSRQLNILLLMPILLMAAGYLIIYLPLANSISSFKREITQNFPNK